MTEQSTKIIEPLAKFHARVLSQNRITLPKETREIYNIREKDYVVVILRKLQDKKPIYRVLVLLRVSTSGVVPLPIELVRKLNLAKGEIIEVLLLRVIHTPRILIQEIPTEVAGEIHKKGFVFLDPPREREVILHSIINAQDFP